VPGEMFTQMRTAPCRNESSRLPRRPIRRSRPR
jgi:hypothetical protein